MMSIANNIDSLVISILAIFKFEILRGSRCTLVYATKTNVTFSHFRSKQPMRIAGIQLNVHWCTFRCNTGKIVHIKQAQRFDPSLKSLIWL